MFIADITLDRLRKWKTGSSKYTCIHLTYLHNVGNWGCKTLMIQQLLLG